jgi:hypothetical protein
MSLWFAFFYLIRSWAHTSSSPSSAREARIVCPSLYGIYNAQIKIK